MTTSPKLTRTIVFALLTVMSLAASTPASRAQSGENYAFAVQAEAGLELVITGYDTQGRTMFQKTAHGREVYNGRQHYIVRIAEEVIEARRMKEWCVEDLSGNWHILPVEGARVTCDTRPVDNRGTFTFVSRTFPGGQSLDVAAYDMAAVICVQKQLNRLGFDAGKEDGIIGGRTFRAAQSYIRYMKAGPGGPGWRQPDLSAANARHWCEKVAEAHPRVQRYWDAIN